MTATEQERHSSEFWRKTVSSESDTRDLAARLSSVSRAGDALLLEGELGVGKTAFARGFIQAFAKAVGDEDRVDEVPSPTFTLVQTYGLGGTEIWHVDLYRIRKPDEILELGLEEAFSSAISLVEWPERLGPFRPLAPLTIAIKMAGGCGSLRSISLSGSTEWGKRLWGVLEETP